MAPNLSPFTTRSAKEMTLKITTGLATLTFATPALAHDGMHIHPHGFGVATLLIVASMAAAGVILWGRK